MMILSDPKFLNVALRGATLASKFLLVFFLAYYLESKEVALYGLVTVTISYSLYALGFDFYNYSTREILGSEKSQWLRLLRDQAVFFLISYSCVLPLLFLLFIFDLLPWSIVIWFFVLLVLEHIAQEINRILVVMSHQLMASIILFCRAGGWAILIIIAFAIWPQIRDLDYVLAAWASGSILASAIGFRILVTLDESQLRCAVDWRWILKGVKIALPLLMATLCLRALFTIDRYWVQDIGGSEVLAAYVIYAGMANAVLSFLDAGVFVFIYPKLITAYKNDDKESFYANMKKLLVQTFLVVSGLCSIIAVLAVPVLELIGKEIYVENIMVLYFLLVAVAFNMLGMVPHYGIYAMSCDRHILISNVLALACFSICTLIFPSSMDVIGVTLALCAAFLLMLIYKSLVYCKLQRKCWHSTNTEIKEEGNVNV